MNKLKVLWFGLVPVGWFLALRLIIWINNYPIDWSSNGGDTGLAMFLVMTGVFGTIALIFGAIGLAVYLQD